MSSENVDKVYRGMESYNRGEFAPIHELYHPDMEWHEFPDLPEARVLKGSKALEAYWRQFADRYQDVRGEVEQCFDGGDKILAYIRTFGHDPETGADMEARLGVIYTFRDGKTIKLETFLDRAKAYEVWRSAVQGETGREQSDT